MRLDAYLAEFWPEHSRTTWQKYCTQGFVKVNGEVITSPNKQLSEDDIVTVDVPEAAPIAPLDLPVLYEDENVVVINKPAGILTHAKGEQLEEFTVAEFMRPRTTFGTEGNRPGIIHRLDRDTSGVLIAAKNPEAASLLGKQFSERKVKKTYVAVVTGVPEVATAKIDLPIGRNPKAPATFRVDKNGKAAETVFETLAHNDRETLLLLKPLTGRTHQLRVHMAYLNCPIKGDRVYGTPAERLFLHAWQLEITVPGGIRKTFIAPVPDDFTEQFNYVLAAA